MFEKRNQEYIGEYKALNDKIFAIVCLIQNYRSFFFKLFLLEFIFSM